MARSGDVLEHPVTGERVVWLKVARDTDGRLLEADLFAPPGGHPAATHVHPHQEERFRIVHGTVRLRLDGKERVLGPGETAVVPPGRAHTWANVGDDQACLRVEIAPALRTEMFFETFFGLAKDGRTNDKGLPNLLSMAVLMREFDAEMQLARPPAVVQRALFIPLALIGRTLGYRGWYPRYTSEPMPRVR
jgi:mannose-6-phosphate isomerase-like protein (cupin superfamily)